MQIKNRLRNSVSYRAWHSYEGRVFQLQCCLTASISFHLLFLPLCLSGHSIWGALVFQFRRTFIQILKSLSESSASSSQATDSLRPLLTQDHHNYKTNKKEDLGLKRNLSIRTEKVAPEYPPRKLCTSWKKLMHPQNGYKHLAYFCF